MPVQGEKNILEFLRENKEFLRSSHYVKEIGLFGSFIRNENTNESDVDILVLFEPEGLTFNNFMGLKFYLEDHFDRKFDLITKTGLTNRIEDIILRETVYA